MKPKKPERSPCEDLFRSRLEQLLDQRHALYRLAGKIDWEAAEARLGSLYSETGRPGIPIRLMVGLHYLKATFNESDETVVSRWVENPCWQYFCGEEFFRYELPIHPSQMTRFRQRIGAEGCEYLLGLTVRAGIETRTVSKASLSVVNVDTTVQEKAGDAMNALLCGAGHNPRKILRRLALLCAQIKEAILRLGIGEASIFVLIG